MGIRQTINEKPAVAITVLVVILLGAGAFVYLSGGRRIPPEVGQAWAWYYDPGTKEVFAAQMPDPHKSSPAPISRSAGGPEDCPMVIRYSSGDCTNGPFEDYLQKFDKGPDGKPREVFASMSAPDKWFDSSSREGRAIEDATIAKSKQKSPNGQARRCLPKK